MGRVYGMIGNRGGSCMGNIEGGGEDDEKEEKFEEFLVNFHGLLCQSVLCKSVKKWDDN